MGKAFNGAKWIWPDRRGDVRNRYVEFKRDFTLNSEHGVALNITADLRYFVYVNGEEVGFGPMRGFPFAYGYDSYDLSPYVKRGENCLAVLALHTGEANMHSVTASPGLLAELTQEGKQIFVSDENFLARENRTLTRNAPKVSMQQPYFEEQYDARQEDDWKTFGACLSTFRPAMALCGTEEGEHRNLQPRPIPYLAGKYRYPQRLLASERVERLPYCVSLDLTEVLCDNRNNSFDYFMHGFLLFDIMSEAEAELRFVYAENFTAVHVNGVRVAVSEYLLDRDAPAVPLCAGRNACCIELRGRFHGYQKTLAADGAPGLRFTAFRLVGPLPFTDDGKPHPLTDWGPGYYPVPVKPVITAGEREQVRALCLEGKDGTLANLGYPAVPLNRFLHGENVFLTSYTDGGVPADCVLGAEAVGSDNGYLEVVCGGEDRRILLDYGHEIVARQCFECIAPAGTILDFHNFEFIQPDGRKNFAENMNNAFRYVCKEGRQTFLSHLRRGFRYSYLTVRGCAGSIKLRNLAAREYAYPQRNAGSFLTSDYLLNRIWEVSGATLANCCEDTYTDCPTIEQVFWVGDMRNEALADWLKNGDSRLWLRCLRLAADSLAVSPLVLSHLPSGWKNVIPDWSFLWQQSVYEYYWYTGDAAGTESLFGAVAANTDGIAAHINGQGLFEINAWNMFDWADMDQPGWGVVTHQNCLAVMAIGYAVKLARLLNRTKRVAGWEALAERLRAAINAHLWNGERLAYTDCLRESEAGRVQSPVFSQQTQTAAYIAGIPAQTRREDVLRCVADPPKDFVRAGSPFFEFFYLEILKAEGRYEEMLEVIRRDWGFMTDTGCDTFWEMWTWVCGDGRLTRSHCHGWSCAPLYFLTELLLGVRPLEPGYRRAEVKPFCANLRFCRGEVPTPHGVIRVQWEAKGGKLVKLDVQAPEGVELVR